MMTRRDFVKGAVGVAAAAAVGGVAGVTVWDRSTQPEDPTEAWGTAQGIDRILLAATLAPSSHNTQPWRFRVGPESIDLLGDAGRTMGKADPRLRELHVSLGCALENAAIAAADAGTPLTIVQVPGAPGSHFATLRFAQGAAASAANANLAAAIPRRRTNRSAYDPKRTVASDTLTALGQLASANVRVTWLTASEACKRFSELSVNATIESVAEAAMQRDSHRWYRMDRDAADRYRDGVTVDGANLPGVVSLMMGLFPPTPVSFDAGWVDATRDTHCGTAPAFGLLVIENAEDRSAWVEAGRTYQRIQLAATLKGISTHPISQSLAIRDRERAAGTAGAFTAGLNGLAGSGEVVLAFRIGYPTRVQQPSMRRTAVVESA